MATVVAPARRDLPAFVLLTFGSSWLVWLSLAPGTGEVGPTLRLVGAFAPSAVAVGLSAVAGRSVLLELLGRLGRWRLPPRWYGFAIGFPAVASLMATGIAVGLGWPIPDFTRPPAVTELSLPAGVDPWTALPVVLLQSLLLGPAVGEELGWRGYLLPRLQARFDALPAGLLVGAVWGVWHLPLWLASGSAVAPVPAFVGILADAVLFTWLFNSTRGSLLPALVFHASIAVTGIYLASSGPVLLEPAVKWAAVVVVARRYGTQRLGG